MNSDYEILKETLLLISVPRFRIFIEFCSKEKDYDKRYEELLKHLHSAAKNINEMINMLHICVS